MKRFLLFSIFFLISITYTDIYAQSKDEYVPPGGARLLAQVVGKDTILLAYLHDIWVFPRKVFKNKEQERFFWRTVRDVKVALPYAKLVANELSKINYKLVDLKSDSDRKKYLKQFEKEVFKKYEADLKKLSVNQGRLLMKLIDRECNQSTFELIRSYKGTVSAYFWQGLALVFGSNLKTGYDASDKDKIIEKVILLVEARQL